MPGQALFGRARSVAALAHRWDESSSNDAADHAVRVLIVDSQRLSGELLAALLTDQSMDVVGVATSASNAVQNTQSCRPQVAVIDLEHPEGAIALGIHLLEIDPSLKLLAISAGNNSWLASEAIEAGFHGCVSRDVSLERFLNAFDSALNGEVVISKKLARARTPDERRARMLAETLTPREREVLNLLVAGHPSDEIARKLSISGNTVRTHVSSILTKLQVHSRLAAVMFATHHRLVRPSAVEH